MSKVNLRTDEPIDRALKRLKRQLDRDDVMRECRRRRHFQKPSAIKRQKMKEAKFKAYLDARDAQD
jgi:small subunit ribosomal protein S21|tara:strand:- start:128 stop:325 length:198 start_codon:yes stop_codon:yes gene_type:complete